MRVHLVKGLRLLGVRLFQPLDRARFVNYEQRQWQERGLSIVDRAGSRSP